MATFRCALERCLPPRALSLLRDVKLVATQSLRILTRRGRHDVAFRCFGGRPLVRVGVNGIRLYVDLRDLGVGQPLYLTGQYEPTETEFVVRSLKPGMTVIDIGANIGYFTTLAARLIGDTGRVIGVEPDPYNYTLLRANVRGNRLRNVNLYQCALGAESGGARLVHNPYNYGDHRVATGESESTGPGIALTPLDQLLAGAKVGRVDFIKMDVQGYECHVLAGMMQTLRENLDLVLLTEFCPAAMRQADGDPEGFFCTLIGLGFRASVLTDDGGLALVNWPGVLDLLPPQPPLGDSYLNLVFRR